MTQMDLGFADERKPHRLAEGAWFLPRLALPDIPQILKDLEPILAAAPLRNLVTPGGLTMSVAMTNCGDCGWISDRKGYRYSEIDPLSKMAWPAMPDSFLALARLGAAEAGYSNFTPNVCLINRYQPGARLTLHQDLNERELIAPIVTVSLGLPATFQFGGLERSDRVQPIHVIHGDMVVWGGASRMFFHGVLPVKEGNHELMGPCRVSLTFRDA